MDFFETSTRNLLAAEAAAGVRHHVVLSVVGAGRLSESPYFRAKIVQEYLVQQSGIPWSIVHATQFFEFMESIADGATVGNTVRLAPVSFLVYRDVVEGRRHLNLTEWDKLNDKRRAKKQKEVGEQVEEGEMPPWFYLPMHSEAKLSDADKALLIGWSKGPVSD